MTKSPSTLLLHGHHKDVVGERVCGSGRFSNVYSADLIEPEERKVAIKNSWYTCMRYQSTNQLVVDAPDFISHQAIFTKVIHCLVLDYFPDDVQKLREKGVKFDALDAQ
ncbi:hypothetical protein ANCDUO_24731, partial [Ancylostoma duodenale]